MTLNNSILPAGPSMLDLPYQIPYQDPTTTERISNAITATCISTRASLARSVSFADAVAFHWKHSPEIDEHHGRPTSFVEQRRAEKRTGPAMILQTCNALAV